MLHPSEPLSQSKEQGVNEAPGFRRRVPAQLLTYRASKTAAPQLQSVRRTPCPRVLQISIPARPRLALEPGLPALLQEGGKHSIHGGFSCATFPPSPRFGRSLGLFSRCLHSSAYFCISGLRSASRCASTSWSKRATRRKASSRAACLGSNSLRMARKLVKLWTSSDPQTPKMLCSFSKKNLKLLLLGCRSESSRRKGAAWPS